jgi:predicted nucleic acid-binding protein
MAVLVDSNVILDIFTLNPVWERWSFGALVDVSASARAIINPVIYAEISARFSRIEDLDASLPRFIEREPLPYVAAFLAGKAYAEYRKRGGTKSSPLPDFFIGAHAAVAGYRLLTRDVARYRTYFPKLELIAPD